MLKKISGYALAGLLAVALLGGTAYILLRPAEAQAERGPLGQQGQGEQGGAGYRGGGSAEFDGDACSRDGVAQGRGTGQQGATAYGRGQGNGGGGSAAEPGQDGYGRAGRGQGLSTGRGPGEPTGYGEGLDHPVDTWTSIAGTVIYLDNDTTLQTEDGEVVVHVGPTWYLDSQGFQVSVGDEVVVTGFYEGDVFEVGAIENQTTGDTLTLRDEAGHPLWAGRGRGGA